jgi:hypothetical protein
VETEKSGDRALKKGRMLFTPKCSLVIGDRAKNQPRVFNESTTESSSVPLVRTVEDKPIGSVVS